MRQSRDYQSLIELPITSLLSFLYHDTHALDALNSVANANHLDQTQAGILIVGPGTSVPELIVTILAAVRRRPYIAVGNIIGSNLMNLSLVIPIGAILIDLPVTHHIARFDVWVMVISTVVPYYHLLFRNGISRITGVFFVSLLALYMYAAVAMKI